jgi:hypothetical protein
MLYVSADEFDFFENSVPIKGRKLHKDYEIMIELIKFVQNYSKRCYTYRIVNRIEHSYEKMVN